jgi:hypothetical protein
MRISITDAGSHAARAELQSTTRMVVLDRTIVGVIVLFEMLMQGCVTKLAAASAASAKRFENPIAATTIAARKASCEMKVRIQ